MSILRLSVTQTASWFHWCAENGFTAIAELDCKEQFNNIQRGTIEEHLKIGSEWLIARKRWRSKEVTWSVHHAHTKMERAGKAVGGNFHYIRHDDKFFSTTLHIIIVATAHGTFGPKRTV